MKEQPDPLMGIDLPLPHIGSGKVREIWDTKKYVPDSRLVITTDRVSVKDRKLLTGIPYKGQVLNEISVFWFKALEKAHICQTHFIADNIHDFPVSLKEILVPYEQQLAGRVMLVREAMVLPWEFIPRSDLFGSAFDYYREHGDLFGIPLPKKSPDWKEGDTLPAPAFTLSTKAPAGQHDVNLTYPEFVRQAGDQLAQQVQGMCLSIYSFMQMTAAPLGLTFSDTKFELGWMFIPNKGYVLSLVDEIGNPDTSRTKPKGLTKQPLRDYLETQGFTGNTDVSLPEDVVATTSKNYLAMHKMLTGKAIA